MCYHLAAYACGIWGGDIPACQANQKTVNLPWSTLQRLCLHETRNVILHWSTCMVHEWPVPAAISEATCSISQHTRFTIRGWPQQFRFSGNIYVHYGDTTNFMLLVTFWPLFPMQSPGLLVGIA